MKLEIWVPRESRTGSITADVIAEVKHHQHHRVHFGGQYHKSMQVETTYGMPPYVRSGQYHKCLPTLETAIEKQKD